MTLPFSVDASDLTLRPAFLALLDAWAEQARSARRPRPQRRRHDLEVPRRARRRGDGARGRARPARDDGVVSLTPSLLGSYRVKVDGRTETRVAAPGERELDLRPRPAASTNRRRGRRRAAAPRSTPADEVALALLGLMALEMGLRAVATQTPCHVTGR